MAFAGFRVESNLEQLPENIAIQNALRSISKSVAWKVKSEFSLDSHRIYDFETSLDGIRILGGQVRIAYNRNGHVDWMSGALLPEKVRRTHVGNDTEIRKLMLGKFPDASIEVEPVYDDEEGRLEPSFDVRVRWKFRMRHFVMTSTGAIKRELKTAWIDPGFFYYHSQTLPTMPMLVELFFEPIMGAFRAVKAYLVNPTFGTPETVTLSGLSSSTKLASSIVYVERDQDIVNVTAVNVDPLTDFTTGFSTNPANYNFTCTGGTTDCPNQGFNAINVYHHLTSYRTRLNTYFSELGLNPSFSTDPLGVIVNSLRLDFDGDNTGTDEANNAAYYPDTCGTDAAGQTLARCLVFLRPAATTATICGGAVQFYDLAREAVVIVHEYQHYVTDIIAHLEPGSVSSAVVGDALHEGYSDYLAASHISLLSGSTVTKVGEYAFQSCPVLIRDVAVVRPFGNVAGGSDADSDPHYSGLSWASGLWKLRTELGAEVTDKLAIKSLFFLSTQPSFLEAVEALVKADEANNGGGNVSRIRDLFYNEVKWVGGASNIFRDTQSGVVETGLRGCLHVNHNGTSPRATFALFIIWLCLTCLIGKRGGQCLRRSS